MSKIYKLVILLLLIIVVVIGLSINKFKTGSEQEYEQSAVASKVQIKEIPAEEKTEVLEAKVVAYYFYRNYRCVTCVNIEKYAKEAIEQYFQEELQNGKLEFKPTNVEESENRHYIKDYQLYSPTLLISLRKDNEQTKWKNLQDVWRHVRNKERFFQYVKEEVEKFLQET